MASAITRRACGKRLLAGGAFVPIGASRSQALGEAPGTAHRFPVEDVEALAVREEQPGVDLLPTDPLELSVAIRSFAENELERLEPDGEGKPPRYRHAGKLLPEGFWPGSTVITRFDLTWGGEAVPIENRFWDDLSGMYLSKLVVPAERPADPEERREQDFLIYEQRLALRSPSISRSAHGGTALVSWPRPEE